MSDSVETYEHAGLTVRIEYDYDVDNSHALDWSRVGTMWVRWNDYDLGDMQDAPDFTATCKVCDGSGACNASVSDCEACNGAGEVELPAVEWIKREHGSRVVLPLSIYEHGGITIRVGSGAYPLDSQGWDSGSAGFIFDTPEGVTQCLGDDATDEEIEAALRAEVEQYDYYLTGQVYGYVIEDEHGEHLDSCWGFAGELDYVRQEANSAAEYEAKVIAHEAEQVAYWAARDVETVAP